MIFFFVSPTSASGFRFSKRLLWLVSALILKYTQRMKQVYIHILTWNDRRYLPDLFESLQKQTYKHITVRVLDNGSTDETVRYLQQYHPHSLVLRNTKNVGFSDGHNQLVRFTLEHLALENKEDAYIMWMNSDMILKEDAVEKLVEASVMHPEISAFQPKLYRAFCENIGDEVLEETVKSDILDTTGLSVNRAWRMSDRGAGEIDVGQYDTKTDIFAPSGTVALLKATVIEDVMMEREMFDKDFFAYREDCDFAWRLQKRGHKTRFVPDAVAHHYRGMYGAQKQSLWKRLKNRKTQNPFFAAYSTRNQLFVLLKNLTVMDLLLGLPWIAFSEIGRVSYAFLFETQTRQRLLSGIALIPVMLAKRKVNLQKASIPESEVRKYARN